MASGLVQRHQGRLQLAHPDFEILGPAERLAMLLVRFDDLPLRHHQIRGNPTGLMTKLIRELDQLKSDGVSPDQVRAAAGTGDERDLRRAEMGDLMEAHDEILASIGCLDENGAISAAKVLLEENPALLDSFVSRHPHLVVDQLEELSLLSGALLERLMTGVRSAVLAIDDTRTSPGSAANDLLDRTESLETVELEDSWRLGSDTIDAARESGIVLGDDFDAGVGQGAQGWCRYDAGGTVRLDDDGEGVGLGHRSPWAIDRRK